MTPIERSLSKSLSGRREIKRQDLIVSVTEQIWAAMETAGIAKTDLAKMLGQSRSHVTQLLSGDRNMTLSTLADIASVLGLTPCVQLGQAPELIAPLTKRVNEVERRVATKIVQMNTVQSKILVKPVIINPGRQISLMSNTNQAAFAAQI